MKFIERYRIELMGIATLSVFVAHILHRFGGFVMGDFIPCVLLYTYGFLFVSGYSIAYSCDRTNWGLVSFYRKRFKSMFIPYIVASFLPITVMCCIEEFELWKWIARLTSLNFFYEGNVCGTWYIAVISVLYLISPLLKIFGKKCMWLFILIVFGLCASKWLCIRVYNYQHIFMFQIPAYFAGFVCYYYKSIKFVSVIGAAMLALGFVTHELSYAEMGVSFLMLIVWGVYLSFSKSGHKTFRWLGENSLLLYLIHLETCFLLEKIGYNPKIAIIVGIVFSIIACKPIKLLSNKVTNIVM